MVTRDFSGCHTAKIIVLLGFMKGLKSPEPRDKYDHFDNSMNSFLTYTNNQ